MNRCLSGAERFSAVKAKSSVLLPAGMEVAAVAPQFHLVCPSFLEHYRRRTIDRIGVNRHHAAHGRKPQPSVAGFAGARDPPLHSPVFMPSASPYEIGRNGRDSPVGNIIHLLQSEAEDPLLGGEPEIALAIIQDAGDFGGQAVPGRNRSEPAIP